MILFSTADLDGFDFFLGFGRMIALCNIDSNLSSASCLFLSWLRYSCDVTRRIPEESSFDPKRESSHVRSASVIEGELARSNTSSACVEVLFTCCPPGPLERTKEILISDSGICSRSVIQSMFSSEFKSVSEIYFSVGKNVRT